MERVAGTLGRDRDLHPKFCLQHDGAVLDRGHGLHHVHGGPAIKAVLYGEVRAQALTRCCGAHAEGVSFEIQDRTFTADEQGRAVLEAPSGSHDVLMRRGRDRLDVKVVKFLPNQGTEDEFQMDLCFYIYSEATPARTENGNPVQMKGQPKPQARRVWITPTPDAVPKDAVPVRGAVYVPCNDGSEEQVQLFSSNAVQACRLPLERMRAGGFDALKGVCPLYGLRIEPVLERDYLWHADKPTPMSDVTLAAHVVASTTVTDCAFQKMLKESKPVLVGAMRPVVLVRFPDLNVLHVDILDYPTVEAASQYLTKHLQADVPFGLQLDGRLLDGADELHLCHRGSMLEAVALGRVDARFQTCCCRAPVANVDVQVAHFTAKSNANGQAVLIAPQGFHVLGWNHPGSPYKEMPLNVEASMEQRLDVPIEPWLYVYAVKMTSKTWLDVYCDAVALDEDASSQEQQVWICSDRRQVPEKAEPIRGFVHYQGHDGVEEKEEFPCVNHEFAVKLPIEGMHTGGVHQGRTAAPCPFASIRVEPAKNTDYVWHPINPSTLANRTGMQGGCELARLLHNRPVEMGTLRPVVQVQGPNGRMVQVDIQDYPTVGDARSMLHKEFPGFKEPLSLQFNGRLIEDDSFRLSQAHGGVTITTVAMPSR
mmetsp:Transcript_96271/g.185617  ORF Transcript_96271/g.185617 Transcript_96271/m.185617 type:complete len:651 (+) Transcript_96271:1-1953(+)